MLFASAVSLAACSGGGSLYTGIMSAFGFDMNDYEAESVLRVLGPEDEGYDGIVRIIGILTLDSARVAPFENPRDAASGNRDAILNYMLNTSYAAYSGNSELLSKASEEYPQYNITTLIPEGDFEGTVYRFFGGNSSVKHENSARYMYLERVGAYTAAGQPLSVTVTVNISNCVETEHTYRVAFTLTDETENTESYTAMIMKREDGTMYMRYLRSESGEGESA